MNVSAEVRWFWRDAKPEALERWFRGGAVPAGGGDLRVDEYLRDPQGSELGVKRRGGSSCVEVKGLVAVIPSPIAIAPFQGRVQVWTKWSSAALCVNGLELITTRKRRWLRRFDTGAAVAREVPLDAAERPLSGAPFPREGCTLEFTEVAVAGAAGTWWTLAFEAFGPFDRVEQNLRRTIDQLARTGPPALDATIEASYPAWLARVDAGRLEVRG